MKHIISGIGGLTITMKILDAGHIYSLDSLDGNLEQTLTFVKREGEKFPFNSGSHAGTNCQEVLRVLIDRSEYLQKQKPCAETECIISSLKTALLKNLKENVSEIILIIS